MKRDKSAGILPRLALAVDRAENLPSRSLARRKVTERIFVEMRADPRFTDVGDAELREQIATFLDAEGMTDG